MGQFIELQASDGFSFPAYRADPVGSPRAAVVVVQEIFGLNSHIRSVADGYAAAGYLAVAPSTFHRVQADVELGYTEADVQAGVALKSAVGALPAPGVLLDLQAAVAWAQRTGKVSKVGMVGFCWGGLLCWRAACQLDGLSAVAPYYGGGMTLPEEAARQPRAPVLAHFGRQDHLIPMDGVEAFVKAHPEVAVHVYDCGHGFNCEQRGSYNAAAASLARQRTLAHFAQHLT